VEREVAETLVGVEDSRFHRLLFLLPASPPLSSKVEEGGRRGLSDLLRPAVVLVTVAVEVVLAEGAPNRGWRDDEVAVVVGKE
jgi:hypothetical protein